MELSLPLSIFFIYIASLCYVIASYYHLRLGNNWTLFMALSIAIPIVFVEYSFSLSGNYSLHTHHGYNPIHILLLTIIFYFVNMWILNVFVLKIPIKNVTNEIIAILLLLLAFYVSDVVH
jgi:hypothetical protein